MKEKTYGKELLNIAEFLNEKNVRAKFILPYAAAEHTNLEPGKTSKVCKPDLSELTQRD